VSESIVGKAPESPDYFAVPTKGEGTKNLNWKVKAVLMGILGLAVLGVAYTFHVRASDIQHAAAEDAETKKVRDAVPPIKKPQGPDVPMPVSHAAPGQVYMQGQNPMPVDEAAKQAQAKKLADLDAAMKAPAGVEKFGMNQAQPPPPPRNYGGEDEFGNVDTNQDGKRAFLTAKNDYSPYLKHTREQPLSRYEVKAGFVIPGVMISGINCALPGVLVGQVRQTVYDSATGMIPLIPAAARLVGTCDTGISAGQESVLVAWNRIIFPDGSSVFLDTMPGAEKTGIAGFHDQVNNHYLRTFGQAFMLSIFSAGMQLSQPRGSVQGTYNAQQIGAAALGQQMAQLGMQLARRNLNMQPTLEIRPGYEFNIMITKDMILPPWRGHPVAQNTAATIVNEETEGSGSYQQLY
jgi:type IV secretion system protein VirB10